MGKIPVNLIDEIKNEKKKVDKMTKDQKNGTIKQHRNEMKKLRQQIKKHRLMIKQARLAYRISKK